MKDKVYYLQVLMGMVNIVLMLIYEIIRNKNDSLLISGQSQYIYWMGLNVHISLFVDLMLILMLINGFMMVLIIIADKLRRVRKEK